MAPADQIRTITETNIGVRMTVPPGWEQVVFEPNDEGFAPLVLAPQGWRHEDGFRPSLTVVGVSSETEEGQASAQLAGTEALAVLIDTDDTHVVSYDPYPGLRVIRAATHQGDLGLVMMQWVLPRPGRTVTATGLVDTDRYSRVAPIFEQLIGQLEWEDPDGSAATEPRQGVTESTEPRTDTYLAHHGEALEDLSRVPQAQAYEVDGLALPRAALVALSAARRGRIRLDRGKADAEEIFTALLEAELVDPDGRLTQDGRTITRTIDSATNALTVEATVGSLPLSWRSWSADGMSVVARTASPTCWWHRRPGGDELLEIPQQVHLQVLATSTLAMEIARWVGLGPGWPLDLGSAQIEADRFAERVTSASIEPPSGATAHLTELWSVPWLLWSVRSEVSGAAFAFVNAGHRGHYALAQQVEAGTEHLTGTPNVMIWDALVELTAG